MVASIKRKWCEIEQTVMAVNSLKNEGNYDGNQPANSVDIPATEKEINRIQVAFLLVACMLCQLLIKCCPSSLMHDIRD